MNPFDLPGPQFLLFYVILAAVLAAIVWIFRHHGESTQSPSAPEFTDPYLVAYLRAGRAEVWRLGTVRLIDRGLLHTDGATISVVAQAHLDNGQNEVERATLDWFRTPREAMSIIKESSLQRLLQPYEERLIELGLLGGKEERAGKRIRFAVAAGTLILVALAKIMIALSRGRSNVAILVMIAAGSVVVLYHLAMPQHTRQGRAVLEDLKKLFARLNDYPGAIKAGQASAEAMWLAAVFGVGSLGFTYVQSLYPKARSGGASCGSSCGGGGCGGGCGGCGG